jgi:hypothetical protein
VFLLLLLLLLVILLRATTEPAMRLHACFAPLDIVGLCAGGGGRAERAALLDFKKRNKGIKENTTSGKKQQQHQGPSAFSCTDQGGGSCSATEPRDCWTRGPRHSASDMRWSLGTCLAISLGRMTCLMGLMAREEEKQYVTERRTKG